MAAFAFLRELTQLHGDTLPHKALASGFVFEGIRVPLLGPQGIFKPAILPDMPLSIMTAPPVEGRARPYDDEFHAGGFLRYKYRGTDPLHRENVGLRLAMQRRAPLVYLFGVDRGAYVAAWPVFIVNDDPKSLAFTVAVDEEVVLGSRSAEMVGEKADARRAYSTSMTLRRVHQQGFRRRVLRAYREICAIYRLRHQELLEAAHILPDGHPRGEPVVPNGLALCSLHHTAFDRKFLGIRPDLRVEIRTDILGESDGPMLIHGLQGFQGTTIHVPRPEKLRPNPDFLAERYEMFRKTG